MRNAGACFFALLLSCGGPPGAGGGSPDAGASGGACPALGEPIPQADGSYASPGDFDRAGCLAEAFSDFDPSGMWYVRPDEERRFASGTGLMRFSFDCDRGLQVDRGQLFTGGVRQTTALTPDDLFARASFDYQNGSRTYTIAWDFCGRSDDALVGTAVTCYRQGEQEDCYDARVRATRFGRAQGESEGEGLEKVSTFTGETGTWWPDTLTSNVEVEDGVAYVARADDGLRIVDVSDPASPHDLAHVPAPGQYFNDLALLDGPDDHRFLFVADDSGEVVIDVTDPADPQVVTTFGGSVHRAAVATAGDKSYAYLADGYSPQMPIYDVTDPSSPTQVGTYVAPKQEWGFHAVYVKDQRAYINATVGGLLVVDVQNPQNPTLLGQFGEDSEARYSHHVGVATIGDRTVAVHGDEGYGAHIEIVDVDPDSPQFMERIGEFQTRVEVSVHNIQIHGSRAYVSWYQDGVRILDLSDPTAPEQIAYYNTWSPETSEVETFEGALDLDRDPDTGLIYVADTPGGLIVLRETADP